MVSGCSIHGSRKTLIKPITYAITSKIYHKRYKTLENFNINKFILPEEWPEIISTMNAEVGGLFPPHPSEAPPPPPQEDDLYCAEPYLVSPAIYNPCQNSAAAMSRLPIWGISGVYTRY